MASAADSSADSPTAIAADTRIEELSDSETPSDYQAPDQSEWRYHTSAKPSSRSHRHKAPRNMPSVPPLFTTLPLVKDSLVTQTTELQDKTVTECLPFLQGKNGALNAHGVACLQRQEHVDFLRDAIGENGRYPSSYTAMDASRPWFVYWSLAGLSMLGTDATKYREQAIYTLRACQHPEGGFGGGHGQLAHLAPSYASILSLAIVGGKDAMDVVDRKAMWHWLGKMKQPDGAFTMCQGGEKDVRGAYCAMVLISLLNLPLSLPPDSPARAHGLTSFTTHLGAWISRCQTYEGGLSDAPGDEAHGAYTFCGLACLSILGKPHKTFPAHLNTGSLLRWLSSRQYAPEGGFAGRTNKLVDGCYSHWLGGCWALLEAAVSPQSALWSREGLIRYVLGCAQGKGGGLRDKPGKFPDAYHTCYNLAGLSAAQYRFSCIDSTDDDELLKAGFGWQVDGKTESLPCDEGDWVKPVHPVYVVPMERVAWTRRYFEGKVGF